MLTLASTDHDESYLISKEKCHRKPLPAASYTSEDADQAQ